MNKIIVLEKPEKWQFDIPNTDLVSAHEYLSNTAGQLGKHTKVINLCKSYQYQSVGYYVSLLAEARGHKVLPEVATIQDFRFPSMIKDDAQDFDNAIQKCLNSKFGSRLEFKVYFGYTDNPSLAAVGTLLFNLFQSPILKVVFVKQDKWVLDGLKPLNIYDLVTEERQKLQHFLGLFLSHKKVVRKNHQRRKFDLAILVNPDDPNPPSNAKALQKFIKAAEDVGFNTELITKNDYAKITQYDALFIRETTNVNNHTFRLAKKAQAEGLVVIDDPQSIMRCTNKVYLNELMRSHGILTPKGAIVSKENPMAAVEKIGFPFILKEPDGAFSKGVKKVQNEEELNELLKGFFKGSELLIAQEFMPTPFDWRVGIFNGQPFYVCKYFMARNHWQIIDWKKTGKVYEGKSETYAIADVPKALITTALKATKLIGNGLYGVDIKEVNKKFYVIEVNDNPNLDAGIEDKILKNRLYETIVETMMERVKTKQ
ncbi:RimK family protein [Roseivirga pacifica]